MSISPTFPTNKEKQTQHSLKETHHFPFDPSKIFKQDSLNPEAKKYIETLNPDLIAHAKIFNFGQAIRFVENGLCPQIGQDRKRAKEVKTSSSYSKNLKKEREVANRDHSGLVKMMEERRKADNKSLDEFYSVGASSVNTNASTSKRIRREDLLPIKRQQSSLNT